MLGWLWLLQAFGSRITASGAAAAGCALYPGTYPDSCACLTSADGSSSIARLQCSGSEAFALQSLRFGAGGGADIDGLLVSGAALASLNDSAFAGIAAGGGVRKLWLPNNGIVSISYRSFEPLAADLAFLDLSGNLLQTDDVDNLPAFKRLSALIVANNKLVSHPTVVFSMPALVLLDLSGNNVASLEQPAPAPQPWPLMTTLNVSGNELPDLRLDVVFASAPALLVLDASYNSIQTVVVGVAVGPPLRRPPPPPLLTLQLRGNKLTTVDFLLDDGFPVNLTALGLAYNNLRSLRAASFAALRRLQELDLRGNALATLDAGFASLAGGVAVGGGQQPQLTSLLVGDNLFECDCSLAWLRTSPWAAARAALCYAPPAFAGVYTLANFPTVGCSTVSAGAAVGARPSASPSTQTNGAVVAVAVLGVVCAVAAVGYVAMRHGHTQRMAASGMADEAGGEVMAEVARGPIDAFGDSAEHIAGKELLLQPAAASGAHKHRGAHPRAAKGNADEGKSESPFLGDLLSALSSLPVSKDGQCLLAAARAAAAEQRSAAARDPASEALPEAVAGKLTNELAAAYLRASEAEAEGPYFSGPMEEFPFAPSLSRIPSAVFRDSQGSSRESLAILTGAATMAGPSDDCLPIRMLEGYVLNLQARGNSLSLPTAILPLVTYRDITASRDIIPPISRGSNSADGDGAVVCTLQVPGPTSTARREAAKRAK